MTRAEVIAAAQALIDAPYRKKGRSAKHGVDCIGVVCVVATGFGVAYVDQPEYSDAPDPNHRMLRLFDRYLTRAPQGSPYPGSIGIFAGNVLPAHTGIFTIRNGMTHLVHARIDSQHVVEQAYRVSDRSEGRLIARFNFPGLED